MENMLSIDELYNNESQKMGRCVNKKVGGSQQDNKLGGSQHYNYVLIFMILCLFIILVLITYIYKR